MTHDQEEALTMSDTIIVMSDGYIQQIGTPEDIYNEPKNAFVADFIGESNIFTGVMPADNLVRFCGKAFPCEDGGFEDVEMRDLIRKVMEKLSDAEKKILQMRYFEEHSQREVAAEMGVSQMYVSRVERKMLARFREALA